jgi:hypothetical protein
MIIITATTIKDFRYFNIAIHFIAFTIIIRNSEFKSYFEFNFKFEFLVKCLTFINFLNFKAFNHSKYLVQFKLFNFFITNFIQFSF